MWTDSHCHVHDSPDAEAELARAQEAGVGLVVCVGTGAEESRRAISLAVGSRRGGVSAVATVGLHPHEASRGVATVLPVLEEALGAGGVLVGIGECGLDYHYDHSPRELQRRAFAAQLALARDTARPVVVHTRDADDDTAAMIREAGSAGVRGVLHCFTGPAWLAETALDAGWYISFSGIVTFKKWDGDEVIRLVPEDRLLIESDAPYLAPVPNRGKRNEPAWVALTAARVAQARGETAGAVRAATTRNAKALFSLA